MALGRDSSRPQWNQVAIADSEYRLSVVATNLSTRATAIRVVVFARLLARSTQGQTLGYRDQVVFSRPRMIASNPAPPAQASATGSSPAPEARPAPTDEDMDSNAWEVVGLWNDDAVDGQHLVQG